MRGPVLARDQPRFNPFIDRLDMTRDDQAGPGRARCWVWAMTIVLAVIEGGQ